MRRMVALYHPPSPLACRAASCYAGGHWAVTHPTAREIDHNGQEEKKDSS